MNAKRSKSRTLSAAASLLPREVGRATDEVPWDGFQFETSSVFFLTSSNYCIIQIRHAYIDNSIEFRIVFRNTCSVENQEPPRCRFWCVKLTARN